MPVISATLERLRQEDGKFETSVRNITRSCQKKKTYEFPERASMWLRTKQDT
jgi:hypothetical protein